MVLHFVIQHDLKWPLPQKSLIHNNMLNKQTTATLFYMKGNKRYYISKQIDNLAVAILKFTI